MKSSNTPGAKQWANLDFLRSVAVLLVVYAHTTLYTGHLDIVGWVGTTGVCFFFVHTSLVLMWSLQRDDNVGRFYLRRIFRIYPLWLVTLGLVLLFRVPISPTTAPQFGFYHASLKELFYQATLTFNLHGGPTVVGASWTLPLEVEMYLLLPYLFFFMRSVQALWPLLLLVLFVILWDLVNFPALNSSLPMCVPYFLGGSIAFTMAMRTQPKWPGWSFVLFVVALSLIGYKYGSYRNSWATCLLLGLSISSFRQLTWRPLVVASEYVARYSYGIYLGHIPALAVGFYYLRHCPLPVRIGGFLTALVLLPVVFYHAVEQPMLNVGANLARKHRHRESTREMKLEPAP